MLTYKYTARDPATGQRVKAEVQAENEQTAAKLIASQGLAPLDVSVKDQGFAIGGKLLHRVKAKDKVLFSRQLSTLINAGLPLVQSLRTVTNQTKNETLKIAANEIIVDVESGKAFSVALGKHSNIFNQVYVSLIAAGEASGTLDKALDRIATQQEKDAEIMSKVKGAMVYPIIVLFVMGGVVGFMLVKVLPQVQLLYAGLPGDNSLPPVTQILLSISNFIIHKWWVVLIGVGVIAFFSGRWARTLTGKAFFDRAKMKMPPLGPLFMKVYMARFTRTGCTLIASGVPLLQVLEITGNAVSNVHIQHSLATAAEKVKGGKSLSEAIKGDPNFLDLVPDMLGIGEKSGSIEQMMERTAEYYEKEVDDQIKAISTIIEPVLMVILGIVAFIIVAAVLLPVYGLAGKSGFGS